jgi:hypothetical protein
LVRTSPLHPGIVVCVPPLHLRLHANSSDSSPSRQPHQLRSSHHDPQPQPNQPHPHLHQAYPTLPYLHGLESLGAGLDVRGVCNEKELENHSGDDVTVELKCIDKASSEEVHIKQESDEEDWSLYEMPTPTGFASLGAGLDVHGARNEKELENHSGDDVTIELNVPTLPTSACHLAVRRKRGSSTRMSSWTTTLSRRERRRWRWMRGSRSIGGCALASANYSGSCL